MRGLRRLRRGLGRVRGSARRLADPPGLILLYHRVAHPEVDPWGVAVRPGRFAEHLEVLRRAARPVPLRDIQGGGWGLRVAITFDDGYADNLHAALPLLEHAGLPATVFVASGFVGQPGPFWWDELGELLLHGRALPERLCLDPAGEGGTWTLGEAARAPTPGAAGRRSWRAEADPAPDGSRERLYLDLYWRLRALAPAGRERALAALRAWAGGQGPGELGARDPGRPVTRAELARLAGHPLVEIGAHTVTHPPLVDLDRAAQRAEIGASRTELEGLTGRPVTSFSFPYGSHDVRAGERVREAGFARACTSASRAVRRDTDALTLPRVSVGDWTGDEFAARLRRWST